MFWLQKNVVLWWKNACKFFGCVFMLKTFYSHFMKPICEIIVPFILHFTALVALPGLLRLFTAHVSSTQGKRNNFKTYYPSKTKWQFNNKSLKWKTSYFFTAWMVMPQTSYVYSSYVYLNILYHSTYWLNEQIRNRKRYRGGNNIFGKSNPKLVWLQSFIKIEWHNNYSLQKF